MGPADSWSSHGKGVFKHIKEMQMSGLEVKRGPLMVGGPRLTSLPSLMS